MEFLNTPLWDNDGLLKLLVKLFLNLGPAFIIIRLLYYPKSKEKDYLFTFFVFNLLTFFICYLLRKVPMEMGLAMGLFAVFGILRYRTESIPIKEMTYLFIVIGLAMINALSNKSISWSELIATNFIILFVTYGIEVLWFKKQKKTKLLIYEKIENILPEKSTELIDDLQQRTGLKVFKAEVQDIDFLKDTAQIKIFYEE